VDDLKHLLATMGGGVANGSVIDFGVLTGVHFARLNLVDEDRHHSGARRCRPASSCSATQTIFIREHNSICHRLREEYRSWSDDDLFERARLINAALIAKIHTVE
jgi:Animal haem peroxidase